MYVIIFGVALVGFLVSLYGYSVERRLKRDANFKPACDISDSVSCSRAFSSKYSKLFGISNTLAGLAFYALIMVLAWFEMDLLILLASIASGLMSLVFAYLLYFKVKSVCVICSVVYILNVLLLLISWDMFA